MIVADFRIYKSTPPAPPDTEVYYKTNYINGRKILDNSAVFYFAVIFNILQKDIKENELLKNVLYLRKN